MKNWSDVEIDFLKENYVEKGVEFCVNGLNRTKDSIKKKAISIGLNLKTRRYQEKQFSLIILESRSFSDVVRRLNLNDGHGNRQTVKKYIDLYKLDISHFDYKNEEKRNTGKIDIKNILVENSTYIATTNLKNRLYKEGLKERKCEYDNCGQGEEWRGRKISLILDHINGVHNDNRLENLRIVCPNCNASLDTHCGKNIK